MFTKADYEARCRLAHGIPNFIGIGAPKAGTTWLSRCLSEHPDVYMAPIKETEFFKFGDCFSRLHEYSKYFAGANGEHAVGEFTVRYLAMEKVPERIAMSIPDVKILVSLRNPIEQVQSWYWHLKKQNQFDSPGTRNDVSLEGAIDGFSELLLGHAFYGRHLEKWFCHFDRRQVMVILYDDICAAPNAVLRELFQFLDVDAQFEPASAYSRDAGVRRGTSPRNRVSGALHRSCYRLLNQVYAPLKRSLGTARAAALKDRLRVRQTLETLFQKPGYVAMSAQTRSKLVDIFASDVEALSRVIDRDLSDWLDEPKQVPRSARSEVASGRTRWPH